MVNLVKKDILLIKKYIVIGIPFSAIGPVFLNIHYGFGSYNFPIYVISNLILIMMFYGSISLLEYKYNSDTFLMSLPYSGKEIVFSKYILLFLFVILTFIIFILCNLAYYKILPTVPVYRALSAPIFLFTIFSLYVPLQLYFGIMNIQYIISGFLAILPILISTFILKNKMVRLLLENMIKNDVVFKFLLLLSGVIIVISMFLSCRIQNKKYYNNLLT